MRTVNRRIVCIITDFILIKQKENIIDKYIKDMIKTKLLNFGTNFSNIEIPVLSFRREKRNYYNNLDISLLTDNKKFWKTVKPVFSDKLQKIIR